MTKSTLITTATLTALAGNVLAGEEILPPADPPPEVNSGDWLTPTLDIRTRYEYRDMDGLDSSNALDIIRGFDVVLDCTDNVATRYLLNDACVLAGKPLVSGSALRFEGQLTVYNYKGTGPTYR